MYSFSVLESTHTFKNTTFELTKNTSQIYYRYFIIYTRPAKYTYTHALSINLVSKEQKRTNERERKK